MKIRHLLGFLLVSFLIYALGCNSSSSSSSTTTTTSSGGTDGGQAEVASPSLAITSPTGLTSYATTGATVTITGVTNDDASVETVTYTNAAGGSGSATITDDNFTATNISLTSGDNEITFTATDADGNTSSAAINVVYNPYLNFTSAPQLSQDTVFVDTATAITVSISIASGSNVDTSSFKLFKIDEDGNETELGALEDDGDSTSNGDDIPNDNIFSGIFTFNESTAGTLTLRAAATTAETGGNVTADSATTTLTVAEHLTTTQFSTIQTFPDQVGTQYDTYVASGMSVDEAKAATVTWIKEQDGITNAGLSDSGNSIWIMYDSETLGGYFFTLDDSSEVRGGGMASSPNIYPQHNVTLSYASADDEITVGSNQAKLISAFYTQFEGWGGDENDEINTTLTESTCPKYEVVEYLKDAAATVEEFMDLEDYGVVSITSHGDSMYPGGVLGGATWGKKMGLVQSWLSQVVVLTRTVVSAANQATYEADILKGRIVVTNSGYASITPAFIRHYNQDMPDSIWYVGSCRSLYNDTLATAVLAMGAKTFFGYSDYVGSAWAYARGKALFADMVDEGKKADEVTNLGTTETDADPATYSYRGEGDLTLAINGLTNEGFEEGSTMGWSGSGDARVISNLTDLSPEEGSYMAIISTGMGSVSSSDSYLTQTFCVPEDMTTLTYKYDFVSEESICYSSYNDQASGKLLDEEGTTSLDETFLISVQDISAASFFLGGDYFASGDNYSTPQNCENGNKHDGTYHSDWTTGTVDVSDYADENTPVTLEFRVWDVGDSAWDSALLVDDVSLE